MRQSDVTELINVLRKLLQMSSIDSLRRVSIFLGPIFERERKKTLERASIYHHTGYAVLYHYVCMYKHRAADELWAFLHGRTFDTFFLTSIRMLSRPSPSPPPTFPARVARAQLGRYYEDAREAASLEKGRRDEQDAEETR